MNCQELQQDIASYKAQVECSQQLLEQIEQTNKKPANCHALFLQAQVVSDELLTKYLSAFSEVYPQLFGFIGGEYGERIYHFKNDIKAIAQISEGQCLVGGDKGETRILTIDNNGQARYSENIEGFNGHINVITKVSDHQFLVGGAYNGETKILTINNNGQAHYSENIEGFHSGIVAIVKTPDNKFLVIGDGFKNYDSFSETKILTIDSDGRASYGDNIEGFDGKRFSASYLSGNQFLVAGGYSNGKAQILTIDSNGRSYYGDNINGFDPEIHSTFKISEGQCLVGSWHGETKILTIDHSGQVHYSENIKGFGGSIEAIAQISDHQFLVGGSHGATAILTLKAAEPSLEPLKQNLDKIITE